MCEQFGSGDGLFAIPSDTFPPIACRAVTGGGLLKSHVRRIRIPCKWIYLLRSPLSKPPDFDDVVPDLATQSAFPWTHHTAHALAIISLAPL